MIAYRIVDEVAEGFLDLVDLLDTHIDDLEDHVEEWPSDRVRGRLSDLRHKMLHVRQTLSPTRDAVRRVVDNRIDTEGGELFSRDLELRFGDSYDKLLRASEGLDLARDLVASVRDYHQAKVANDQNEVMKRLTVIASVLLVPDLHRRPVRPEPEGHPRVRLELRLLVVVGPDRAHHDRPDHLLPAQGVDLRRALAAGIVCLAAACGGSGTPGPPGTPAAAGHRAPERSRRPGLPM